MEEKQLIFEKLTGLLNNQWADANYCKEMDVNRESNLRDDLSFDSLDVVELIMATEKEFAINITDAQASSVETIEDLISIVQVCINASRL